MPIDQSTSPPLNFRFSVVFFIAGVPDPINIRFQNVRGLSSEVDTFSIQEGGQNLYTHRLPQKIQYGNLTLERGKSSIASLNLMASLSTTQFRFVKSNVLISLLDEDAAPISSWMFREAYPVHWGTSDFMAMGNEVVIDKMELAFKNFLHL